jgi:transposase
MAKYKPYNQKQSFLIPFDTDVNIPEGSFPRFLNNFFDQHVDIKLFEKKRKNDSGGAPAKHCIMMLKIIFYAFSQSIYSMRELSEKYLMKHIEFIYLSGNQYVEHSTLSRFITQYMEEITEIFARTVYIANNMGFISKKLIAIDSTPIRANASLKFSGNREIFHKKKAVYEKMIKNLLERARKTDEKITSRERKNIERLQNNYNNALDRINEFLDTVDDNELEKTKDGKEKQVNLIDRDSVILKKGEKYMQGYKCQMGINDDGIIISPDVSGNPRDQDELERMVLKTKSNLQAAGVDENNIKGKEYVLDRGYINIKEIGKLTREGYDLYMHPERYGQEIQDGEAVSVRHCTLCEDDDLYHLKCPGGLEMSTTKDPILEKRGKTYYVFSAYKKQCKDCRYYSRCIGKLAKNRKKFMVQKNVFEYHKELNQLQEKMAGHEGRRKYNKRFWLGEHGFGIITEHRKFKRFLVRGMKKVTAQWNMVCTAFNIRKLWALNQC